MKYEELISNANLSFASNVFYESLRFSQDAIATAPNRIDGYICAGKASMSLDQTEDAIKYFKSAVKLEPNNGNIYFLLGYAQILSGNTADALKSLTKAVESNCDDALKGQIYKMMSMINTDQGDFKNALVNLEQAEGFVGLDYEILQQKAACHASLRDFHETIFTLNQMKLLQPNRYEPYSLAFNIFMELEIYDEALSELERAEEYAELTMAYYNDRVAYTLLHDPADDTEENIKTKWQQTLVAIDTGLTKGKPDADQVFDLYLRAAQLYLSLENPQMAVDILDAAANSILSYNNSFSILDDSESSNSLLSGKVTELTPEEEEAIMQEKWDNGEFDDIREEINEALMESSSDDPEEISEEIHKYLSPVDIIPKKKNEEEKHILTGEFKMEPLQYDMRNALYIAAYELLEDYDSMLQKAREMQASSIVENQYSGIYYELKVGKYTNKENWQKKYRERINFWTKRMLEDPTDFISASYRIRSYIDIGDFDNAEQLCACLPTDAKAPLMEEIRKAKARGGGENVDSH
ncbi:MAG: tetratricopeptide repeat protein [Ruminococcus sp.]|nr:tetratricopeptide repeat protein [Ruminococcus sp.]